MSFRFPLLIRLSGVLLAFCALAATSCSSTSNGTPESSSVSETMSSLLPAAEGKTEYPLTLTSPYGESVVDKRPTRVATVGANAVDTELLLSLGGVPVTTNGLGFNKAPWLKEAAADRIELVFETESWDQYPYESIAAAKPDVIVVFGYDLTNSFAKLSEIAPVVTSDKPWTGYFSNPWQDNIRILGKALDLSDAAEKVISDYDSYIAGIKQANPGFAGKSLSYTVWFGTQRGLSYQSLPGSIITEVFTSMGFTQARNAGSFSETQTVSPELMGSIDADVLIVSGSEGATEATPEAIPGLTDSAVFQGLEAWKHGHHREEITRRMGDVHGRPDGHQGGARHPGAQDRRGDRMTRTPPGIR